MRTEKVFKPEEFENAGFAFSCRYENVLKTMTSWYWCDFPARDFLKHNRAPTNLKLALLTNEMNTSNLPVLSSDLYGACS